MYPTKTIFDTTTIVVNEGYVVNLCSIIIVEVEEFCSMALMTKKAKEKKKTIAIRNVLELT